MAGRVALSLLVTFFITIGATVMTTIQLEEIQHGLERSVFRREIQQMIQMITRVGSAYGKTQLVIMVFTVIISAVGLTMLGAPYALENLIAMYVGLQLFGILGLFLGPIGYLLIKESVTVVDRE